MKLLRDKVQVRELGFPPCKLDISGITSTWSFGGSERSKRRDRCGIITAIGTDVTLVKEGDIVFYKSFLAVKDFVTGINDSYLILETDLDGIYSDIELTNNGKTMSLKQIKFTPIGDRVVVKGLPEENKTESGFITSTEKAKTIKGEVVAVGELQLDRPLVVKVGDQVLYGALAGVPIELEEGDFLIMREADIFGIL